MTLENTKRDVESLQGVRDKSLAENYEGSVYKDEQWLRWKYRQEGLDVSKIAELAGCSDTTIIKYTKKFGIKRRWKDQDWLYNNYIRKGKTQEDVASLAGCTQHCISRWLRKFGIKTRSTKDYMEVRYNTGWDGYERWRHEIDGMSTVLHTHQLLAISEGADPYMIFSNGEAHVHHKNSVKWDNRPENIEVLSKNEHAEKHSTSRQRDDQGRYI